MAARHRARKRALDILYEADVRGLDPLDVLASNEQRRTSDGESPHEYTAVLVDGVQAHRAHIDELLSSYSLGWTLERMPPVDRNILRMGAFELLWGDVPEAVAIDEAVQLSRELSTDESPAFVNGLLGRLKTEKATLEG